MRGIEIKETDNGIVIKLDKQFITNANDIKPEDAVNELKMLIESRESIIKRSMLQVYFDRDMLTDIRYLLAKLMAYYYIEGKRSYR